MFNGSFPFGSHRRIVILALRCVAVGGKDRKAPTHARVRMNVCRSKAHAPEFEDTIMPNGAKRYQTVPSGAQRCQRVPSGA